MSIIKLVPEYFQNYNLVANPKKTFMSSSGGGVTGSIKLFANTSTSLKDLDPTFGVSEEGYDDSFIENSRAGIINTYTETPPGPSPAGFSKMLVFLDQVNSHSQGERQNKRQEVLRFIPGARLDKNHGRKATIQKILYPYYQAEYQNLEWAYTNYNCLHFYESDNVPSDSALIYPAGTGSFGSQDLNFYAPSGSFTFDFYFKPKVNLSKAPGSVYNPGTILHMSSCYAISAVSGTKKDRDGLPGGFRVLLQLSQSADVAPSSCVVGRKSVTSAYGDTGLMFASSDNSLIRDHWNHVSITWPGKLRNGGTGSIYINGKMDTNFIINSGSVMQSYQGGATSDDPNALFVGNYYQGKNFGNEAIARYFNSSVSSKQGLTPFVTSATEDPGGGVKLSHPLQGELHEIKIYNTHKSELEIKEMGRSGVKITRDLLFYVPPFFVQETRKRNILQTPFFDVTGSSEDPFNVSLSFGVGGREINLENFTREFIQKEYPRLHNLTSSRINTTVSEEGRTANDILYASGSSLKRLFTVLPCDNGKINPNFNLLQTGSFNTTRFVDSFGTQRYDLVDLSSMVSLAGYPVGLRSINTLPARSITGLGSSPVRMKALEGDTAEVQYGTGSFLFDITGASPEDPSVSPGNILTILQRTGDPSSNEVVFFDASNIFYGDKINPGSVLIEDTNPEGSAGSFNLSLRDNKLGNIYRCDTPMSQSANWASVGNILYEEGIIVIKSPHLGFFGKNEFKITFEGERTVYVFEVSVPVNANLFNSSSNPQYKDLYPTDNISEISKKFSYITGVNLHDENFNVVGKASLAQPFVKREGDKVVIKLRMDY